MVYDFFVSYTGVDRKWAEWIAASLESARYTTVLQAWDFRPADNFVERMDRAMRESSRTVAVVSRAYYRSAYAVPEWTNAVTRDPTGRLGVLVPVRIDDVVMEGIFAAIAWIDLSRAGEDEEAARKLLIEGVQRQPIKPTGNVPFPKPEVRPRFPGALPPIWHVPHDRNPAFTGRDDLLTSLREQLAECRLKPAIAALTGTGGVGKTAISVEHCYRASADYQVEWWVRSARREFAAADLAALAGPLGISKRDASGAPDGAADLENVRQWLAQHDQWLLVFDEAEDEGVTRGLIPQGGGGHVLLSSRNPAWRRQAAVMIEVPVLESPSSVQLLQTRTGMPGDRYAGKLAKALGGLPLGLELAAAFMERQGIGFRDYLLRLRRSGGLPDGNAPPDYAHTLATVWSESLKAMEHLAPDASDLLRVCAYVAPDDLPRWVVTAGASALPERLRARSAEPDSFAELVAGPRGYSLITSHGDGFSMHRLLQTMLRQTLDAAGQRLWAGAAVGMIQLGFPVGATDTRLWERASRLISHAVAAADHAGELGVNDEASFVLMDRVAGYLQSVDWKSARAAEFHDRALALAEKVHGREAVPVWLLNNQALSLIARGERAAARPLLERAIAQEKATGLSAGLGLFYSNLGALELDEKNWERARDTLRRGVNILDRYVEQADPKVATAHSKLGRALIELGDFKAAEPELRRAVELYGATLGPSAADTMYARSLLEGVRHPGQIPPAWHVVEHITPESVERDRGRALLGEPQYRSEAEERLTEAADGGDNAALFHLWELLKGTPEREAEAAQYLERAVAAAVPKALYWRGRQLADEPGHASEAEALMCRAIDAGETYSWYDLGQLLSQDPSRQEDATAAFRAAIDAGHDEARNDLGLLLLETPGREAEGERELREAGRRGQPRSLHNLGHYLAGQERLDEAIAVFREAIAGGYLESHLDLGIALHRAGKRREAEQEFRAAARSGDPRGFLNLGILCEMEERPHEAEGAYRAAVERKAEGARKRLAGFLARESSRTLEAIELLLELANEGDAEAWYVAAGLALKLGDNQDFAESAYRNAIALGYVTAWNNLGIMLSRLGNREMDAEEAFVEAIRTGHPRGWDNLAIHLEKFPERAEEAARARELAQAKAGPAGLARWASG